MSWEHFEVGLRVLQHEERRAFMTAARAARISGVAEKDFKDAMQRESIAAGLIDGP